MLVVLVCFSKISFAQLGMSLEEATKLPDRIGLKNYSKYGEEFVQVTTEDKKGLVLEMDFLKNRCESARWGLREGKLPEDFAQEVWKANFKNEEFINKGDDPKLETWRGKKGGLLSRAKTKNGMEIIWVRSTKYDKLLDAEAMRIVKNKTSENINQDGSSP